MPTERTNPQAADAAALAACIDECVAAPSGHGRRWAKQRAHLALQASGARPWLSAALATAAEQVALSIKAKAA